MVYALKFDSDKLARTATNLGNLSGEDIGKVVVNGLNTALDEIYDLARKPMNAGINLSDDYLRRKMYLTRATPTTPVASITAPGDRDHQTPLSRYGAKFNLVPVTTKAKSRSKGLLPIPQGMKQRAVSVEVRQGGDLTLLYAFMLPLKRGLESGGNGLGVFARSRDGKMHHRYGPAVYQLFRYQLQNGKVIDDSYDVLSREIVDQVEAAMTKALSESQHLSPEHPA